MTGLMTIEGKVTESNATDYLNRWINFSQVKPSSIKSYKKGVKNFLTFLAATGEGNLSRETLLSYKKFLGEKYKAATANLYLTATKLFISFLYQEEKIIGVNIADRIKNFKVAEQHSKDALAEATVKKIIAGFDTSTLIGKRDLALFMLMASCGLRCVEVMRANVADLVKRGDKTFLFVQGKGRDDKNECVEVPPGVLTLINNYLSIRAGLSEDAPLFASLSNRNFGSRLTTTSLSRIIKGIYRKNGIKSPRITAHSLRHTCANTMILNNHPLRKVQEVLRHKNITVTQRYLHELDRYQNGGECICAAAFGL